METLFGFAIAFVIGLTGIGGGTLATPALILLLKVPPSESVGTALLFSAFIKLSASLLYLYRKQVNFKVLSFMLLGGTPGAAIGAICVHRFQVTQHPRVILAIVGATVAVSAGFNLLRDELHPVHRVHRPKLLASLSLLVGVQVGFSSVGAGALGTVLLFGLTELAPVTVVGTDIAFGTAVSVVGSGVHIATGTLNGAVLWKMLAGGVIGVLTGSSLASAVSPRIVRSAVLSWAAAMGLLLIYKSLVLGG